ncbi:MAG TPA: MBL fold metallo-hydrolase [Candidatus Sulfotelmatobacter sp.]|nr:MBL fold metallo-hydrolase [Candidatus Sulfotelmatobacter sp.]
MKQIRTAIHLAIFLAICSYGLHAQFGPPEPQGSGPKLAPPTAFPAPGTFPTTESITLSDADPNATIYYTWDGSTPTRKSLIYDPRQLLFIGGVYEGDHGLKTGYTLRAMAVHQGNTNSDVANFQYVVDRRDRTAYVSEEVLPGVRMVRDSDNDKMFLVRGTTKCVLIDSGQGRGELKSYLSQFTGGLPIEPIFTHNHGDHIGQADQFIRDSVEHIGEPDRPVAEKLLKSRGIPDDVIAKNLLPIHEGDRIDLGDRSLIIHEVPGHTNGSLVVFDEKNGWLFTGDSYGSNSPTIPDALWLQWSQVPLDRYLAAVKTSHAYFRGKVTYLMTGHNDHPLEGEAYLNNLESALQSLMDKGDAVLVPSYRPAGAVQVTIGDRMHDPNWVAININKDHYLPGPVDAIAGLTRLEVKGATLVPKFSPEIQSYRAKLTSPASSVSVVVESTSSRSKSITVNGTPVKSAVEREVSLKGKDPVIRVHVESPDGSRSADYAVTIDR